MTNVCRLCGEDGYEVLIDLGSQPVSHRFVETHEVADEFPMALGQCEVCGVAQLSDPMPVEAMVPKFDWIKFNEPEDHLGEMVQFISSLPGITKESRILGISKHDKPLLLQLSKAGFTQLNQVSAAEDLGLLHENTSEALIQAGLDSKAAESILKKRGSYEIVLARRVLEHAFHGSEFLETLKSLLSPGGLLVLEVPDCKSSFDNGDVSTLWEEHISYFTEVSLDKVLSMNSLETARTRVFEYPDENALVVAAHASEKISEKLSKDPSEKESNRINFFVMTLTDTKRQLGEFFENYIFKGGKVAILGAGHRSCTFVNVLEIGKYLEFFVDDDPNKHSLHIPGCGLPIRNSKSLVEEDITLCLLGINPLSEERFIQNQKEFEKKGGQFLSIAPNSSRAIRPESISLQLTHA